MTNSNEELKVCTCPSGDGSLKHPCPIHPPSKQSVNAWWANRLKEVDDIKLGKPIKQHQRQG